MTKEELKQEAEVKEWKDKADLWCKTANLKDHNIMINKELEKENAELKNQVSFLKDNLRVARKDRENLQLDVAKGLKEFVKDYPATALRFLANEKYVEQLTKAKVALRKVVDYLGQFCSDYPDCVIEAEKILKEE
jgi:hypothetical protein